MTARRSSNKDLQKLLDEMCDQGWEVASGSKHLKCRKAGETVIVAVSPSDHRSLLNVRSQFRHAELRINEKKSGGSTDLHG